MDAEKLRILQSLQYKLNPCCKLCEFGNFKPNQMFGTCSNFTYFHRKHTDNKRQLSIHANGICKFPGNMKDQNPEFFGKI